MSLFSAIEPSLVPVFETFVVPRFLHLFAELALEMLIPSEGAVIAHLACRTGFPDRDLVSRCAGATVIGMDSSAPALELAQTKSTLIHDGEFQYQVIGSLPVPFDDQSFSHCLSLYPLLNGNDEWAGFAEEAARLLAPGGQLVCAVPLRGSYPELLDLLREYATKQDVGKMTGLVNEAARSRPSIEHLGDYFENAGLDHVDVDLRLLKISFRSGRDFVEDPIVRLLILPDLVQRMGGEDLSDPLRYVREAIDLYWSEMEFALSINIGCVSGRKPLA